MAETIERELDWTEEIENDGPDFITLPEGDYEFTVTSFERSRYEPREGAKLPACNMAVLRLQVDTENGSASFTHRLYLHTRTEGMLCAFFTAIGQRRHGERLTMNWNTVVGSRGRARIGVRKYVNKYGEEVAMNEVKRFYDPEEAAPAPAVAYKPDTF